MTSTPAPPAQDHALRAIEQMLKGLKSETLEGLGHTMRVYTAPAGTLIMAEGEHTNALYLIESGAVTIFRKIGEEGEERLLATLPAGSTLGEMALLDGEPRSASARTKTDCQLIEIDPENILALPHGERILADIRSSLAIAITNRMRSQTDKYVAVMEREMTAIKERQHFGQFFLYTLGLMTIGMLVNDIIAKQILKVNIFTPTFAWLYLLVILLPTSVVIWRMKIPLKDLGVTTVGIKKSLIEGCLFSVIALVVAFSIAWLLAALDMRVGTPVPAEWGATTGYFFHSVLQELVARGLLQSSFQRFLDDRRGIRSVVLASLLFGVFHIHFGLLAVMATIISGLLFGFVYLRHRNLAGVTVLHFFVGGAAFWSGLL
jgi:CRP-like cAMP-binding protein